MEKSVEQQVLQHAIQVWFIDWDSWLRPKLSSCTALEWKDPLGRTRYERVDFFTKLPSGEFIGGDCWHSREEAEQAWLTAIDRLHDLLMESKVKRDIEEVWEKTNA